MSLVEVLDQPRKWWLRFCATTERVQRRAGVMNGMTAEQKKRVLSYRGTEASGDQDLPKFAR